MKYAFNRRSTIKLLASTVLLSGIATSGSVTANEVDEAAAACVEAARLIKEEDDLEGAIEEASWCLTGLKQLQEEIKLSLLPDELNGFTGGEIDNQNVMGMSIVERKYTRDSDSLTISMTTTGSAGAAGGLGALAELGKLFGSIESAGATAGGGKKVRIQKRTAIVVDEGGNGVVTVQLKSGGSLKAESSDLNSDELVEFMRAFPVADIDDAMDK